MPIKTWPLLLALLPAALALPAAAATTTPAALLAGYQAQSGKPADAERGRQLFVSRQGGEWSCASCHQSPPTTAGRHAGTGKTIDALAPAFNPRRFSDEAKVEKWFRRNCKDVMERECTAGEKADVLAWLITLKP